MYDYIVKGNFNAISVCEKREKWARRWAGRGLEPEMLKIGWEIKKGDSK